MQQVSRFDPSGIPANGSTVIAQIYFRTNETKLDPVDRIVIRKLASHVRTELRARGKADLVIVGRADNRGDRVYNRKLGSTRAASVARLLNQELSGEPNFNAFVGLSHGEKYSRQGTSDPFALALDRRVDVWLSRDTYRLPKMLEDANVHVVECGERRVAVTHQRLFQEWFRFDPRVDEWMIRCSRELKDETQRLLEKEIEKEKAALAKRAKGWPHGGVIFEVKGRTHDSTDLKLEHKVEDESVAGTRAVHWVYHVESRWSATLSYKIYQ